MMVEDISAIQTVKALRAEQVSFARLQTHFMAMVDAGHQSQRIAAVDSAWTLPVSFGCELEHSPAVRDAHERVLDRLNRVRQAFQCARNIPSIAYNEHQLAD